MASNPGEAERSNVDELARLTGIPVVGVVGEIAGIDVDAGDLGEIDDHLDDIDLDALAPSLPDYQTAITADAEHVWHPFTAMREYLGEDPAPLMVARASGCQLEDTNGRRYIDGVSSLWVTVHGHRVRELDDAVRAQLGKVAHSTLLGLSNEPSAVLAGKLAEVAPEGLTRVFYSDNGSTAVEIALKMAFQFWRQTGRPEKGRFVSFVNAYHGDTIGAVSVGGIDLFHQQFGPMLFDATKVHAAYCYRCPVGTSYPGCGLRCLDALEEKLAAEAERTAALVMEPKVQGAAGILVQPPGYLRRIADLCREHDVLLIADEVATGFGRTGSMFACEQEDVRPDLMAVAKGITGGYLPLAATLATERIYEAFLGTYEESKQFFHGHTYTGNPLACAVAIANLDLIERHDVVARAARSADALARMLEPVAAMAHVGDVRRAGMMVGIELVADKSTGDAFPVAERVGRRVILKARERGVIIRPLGDTIVFMPPLAIPEADLRELVDVTAWAIAEVTEG
ncbi:MAG: adenosylmethionine--8-amino-7-oxononanoate transaminase [Coriobacteriales bacterium]|nr:adenosylmethionine--8-amino-7-oxononanoate transaminase [Coriobacteriales bacterium]